MKKACLFLAVLSGCATLHGPISVPANTHLCALQVDNQGAATLVWITSSDAQG
jgi:hypothetical protein